MDKHSETKKREPSEDDEIDFLDSKFKCSENTKPIVSTTESELKNEQSSSARLEQSVSGISNIESVPATLPVEANTSFATPQPSDSYIRLPSDFQYLSPTEIIERRKKDNRVMDLKTPITDDLTPCSLKDVNEELHNSELKKARQAKNVDLTVFKNLKALRLNRERYLYNEFSHTHPEAEAAVEVGADKKVREVVEDSAELVVGADLMVGAELEVRVKLEIKEEPEVGEKQKDRMHAEERGQLHAEGRGSVQAEPIDNTFGGNRASLSAVNNQHKSPELDEIDTENPMEHATSKELQPSGHARIDSAGSSD